MRRNRADGGPCQHERYDRGIRHVRPPAHAVMAKHPAQDELHVEYEDGEQSEREQAGMARIELDARLFLHPLASSEKCDGDRDAEKCLRHRGVRRGNCRRLKEQNCEPSQNGLRDDRAECAHRQPSHPAAPLHQQSPDGDGQCQRYQRASHHAVAPFIAYAAHKMWHLHQVAKRGWPVGNRQPCVIAGDQRTRGNHDERGARRKHGEGVMGPVVRYFNGSQSGAPQVRKVWKTVADVPSSKTEQTATRGQPARERFVVIKSTSKQLSIQLMTHLLGSRLEGLVYDLAVFGGDRNLLVLLAQLLLYEGDGVVARGQALDFVFSALVGYRVERALHHADIHLHPGMLVALDRQHDLFAGEILLDRRRRWWLRFVPLAIVFRGGMDVVGGLVVVFDLHGLSGHHAQHMGVILAAALVEHGWGRGNIKRAAAEAILHVHEYVGEIPAIDDNVFCLVHTFAGRALAHIDLRRLGSSAVEFYGAAHGGNGGRIDRSRRRRRRWLFRRRAGRLLFFLVACGCNQ